MSIGPCVLMTGLHDLKEYIAKDEGTLIDYHYRQQTCLRVSSCGAESTVNCLINRRMNKSQQMRWSRRGADLLLQVRAARAQRRIRYSGSTWICIARSQREPARVALTRSLPPRA
jgi:hypothetical protein